MIQIDLKQDLIKPDRKSFGVFAYVKFSTAFAICQVWQASTDWKE